MLKFQFDNNDNSRSSTGTTNCTSTKRLHGSLSVRTCVHEGRSKYSIELGASSSWKSWPNGNYHILDARRHGTSLIENVNRDTYTYVG